MMRSLSLHSKLGLLLCIPLLLWAVTGLVFLLKPGYGDAYDQLAVKRYDLERGIHYPGEGSWREVTLIRTVLGYHFLVFDGRDWKNIDALTLEEASPPEPQRLRQLVADAISADPERYGNIVRIQGNEVFTDTHVRISLDWNTLTLRQEGRDTRIINSLYKIHYLQWLGFPGVNTVFGAVGLALLAALTILGLVNYREAKRTGRVRDSDV